MKVGFLVRLANEPVSRFPGQISVQRHTHVWSSKACMVAVNGQRFVQNVEV